jgi:hypothetical protein
MLSLPPAGGTGKKIDPAKLFGEDKYEKYASEMAQDGTLDGERLTVEERKEGVRAYRKGKIDFEKFVNKVLKIKEEVSAPAPATGQARLTGSTFMPRALPQAEDLASPVSDDEDIPEGLDDLLNNLRTEQDELQAKLDALIEEVRKDDDVDGLDARLDDLLDNIRTMNEIEEQQAEVQRKKDEEKKRKKKEEGREKVKNFLVKPITKALAPVNNLFQKIIEGLFKVLFAKALIKLIDWFTDPKNKEKIDAIGRFIKDFWPAIVAGFLIFGTGLGGFAKTLLGTAAKIIGGLLRLSIKLAKITTKLALKAGKGLLNVVKGNPITSALVGGALLAGTGAFIASQQNENRRAELDAADDASVVTPKETREEGQTPSGSQLMQESILQQGMGFAGGGLAPKGTDVVPSMLTPGAGLASKGTDVVPAMLTPGEFIMSKGAVDTFGTDFMESINSMGGGSNKPKKIDGTTYASTGGQVGNNNTSGSGVGKKIVAGAKKIIGLKKNVKDMCAFTTRAALKAAGHPAAEKRTQKGDLDTPKGTAYNGRNFAASFGGTDMGRVITSRSQVKMGDILLWRADRNLGGSLNKGAITHVGIAADDGLKHQYDHSKRAGFHYRPHWNQYGGTSWFAAIRLGESGGMLPPELPGASEYGGSSTPDPGDPRISAVPRSTNATAGAITPNASSPGAQGITPVPIPLGSGQQQAPGAQSSDVPQLGSVDPNNVSLLVMQSMYNLGGA